MTINEIKIGDYVLVQTGAETREHATIKGINSENDTVIVKLTDGDIVSINPMYILKSFGQ